MIITTGIAWVITLSNNLNSFAQYATVNLLKTKYFASSFIKKYSFQLTILISELFCYLCQTALARQIDVFC